VFGEVGNDVARPIQVTLPQSRSEAFRSAVLASLGESGLMANKMANKVEWKDSEK